MASGDRMTTSGPVRMTEACLLKIGCIGAVQLLRQWRQVAKHGNFIRHF
jgi:hypothetical protein